MYAVQRWPINDNIGLQYQFMFRMQSLQLLFDGLQRFTDIRSFLKVKENHTKTWIRLLYFFYL